MFKKTRIKITAVLMGVFLLLFAGTVCIIYFYSYHEVSEENLQMLIRYARAYWENGSPDGEDGRPPEEEPQDFEEAHSFLLRSFYSVAFSPEGEMLTIDNTTDMWLSDEALCSFCAELAQKDDNTGVVDNWVYYIEENDGVTLVVLMDNTLMSGSISTLLRYTLIFGCIAVVLLFLFSIFISRSIVRPLEENSQKQKQFISDAGHELKTPLAVISANAEILEREQGQSKWLDNMKSETDRMTALVRRLLDLARADSSEPVMEKLDLSRLVTGAVLPFESLIFEQGKHLETHIQENILITGNGEQLTDLVSILLDNALEHSSQGSLIHVSLRTGRSCACLMVSNEGEAIPPEKLNLLFDRFYRADAAREGENPHYGLGLSIGKAIVTSHHGKIEAACKDGQVIFTVTLPSES